MFVEIEGAGARYVRTEGMRKLEFFEGKNKIFLKTCWLRRGNFGLMRIAEEIKTGLRYFLPFAML
ncbi:hypothetical protein ACLOJK_032640 [Asimina triloba]